MKKDELEVALQDAYTKILALKKIIRRLREDKKELEKKFVIMES